MYLCHAFALALLLLLTHPFYKGVNAGVNENQIQVINSYVDVLETPCNNYYRYACGNWGKVHSNEKYTEITTLIDHKVNKRLIDYFQNYKLEGSAEAANETYTDKLFLYYQTCRRADKQLKRYLQLVRPSLHLDWQLMLEIHAPNATWPAQRFNWLFTLAKLRRYNFKGAFFEHIVVQRPNDAKRFVIDLDKPTDKMPESLVIAVLLMGLGVEKRRAMEVATNVHNFENSLKVVRDIEDDREPQIISLQELERIMPLMPWRLYLQIVLSYTLPVDYEVQISNRDYFIVLSKLLEQTDPSLIDNYIMVKFVLFLIANGPDAFGKVDCARDVRIKMELGVNFLYKQQFLGKADVKVAADVERIFELTKREFAAKLNSNRMHLQPNQLDFLQRKLTTMRYNIGNLPASVNERFVDDYYADVHINTNAHYKNHLALLKLAARKEHDQLTAPPPDVSDYYYNGLDGSCTPLFLFRRNLVVIPYAFLQPPAYHVNMHDILKMGIFGFVFTHEIMHGFESSGVRFDYTGKFAAIGDTILSNDQFSASLTCMEQTETESIDERMADFMAIRVAYDTLFGANSSMNTQQPSYSNITPKRLFFLTVAQFFCGNLRSDFYDHDADDVRLQQTLMQFEPFAAEYGCSSGDPMYLENKCLLY
ncbi:neprilysin-4 [Zeugodacus cucurbitae]|uniref:Membrane metallo-endopeptidase-like 1 n=1 Tax=Zeugodacus cucurbitae TaxID=28588 RepID=A0A0A1X6P0_ZEUCU|nr:neprilysin-4 [Zeugodacus cucurbitae]